MFIVRRLLSLLRPVVERFPRIALLYRSLRDQLAFMEEPVMTPWGFKLAGNSSMAQGTFEPAETELIRSLLKDVDVLVNVGANIGYYCCHALSMGKKVIAFEPMPRNMQYLCKNMKTNNWVGAEIYPIALSNKAGVLEMYGGDTSASLIRGWAGASEAYTNLVPLSTMDTVLGKRLHGAKVLVLVDIEGAETWMLEGATELLASDPKPIWLVEIMTNEHQPAGATINPNFKKTFELFYQYGYESYSLGHELTHITMEHVDMISKGIVNTEAHNYIFR